MHKIFTKRFGRMVKALSTPEVYKGWGFSSAPTPGDVFKQFGSDPIYLLRLPAIELQRLVNTPCPVKTIGQEERPQFIESFKRVRDTLKVQEQKICKSCRLNKECKLAFKLPNLRTSADLSDVLNVLTVYAQIAIELEKIYQKIPVNNLDSFEKQLEGLDKPERNQIKEKIDDLLEYSGKYKYCLQILSGVEAMIYESYDASKPLIEFTNAISFQESYIAQESSITQKKDNIPENMEKSRSKANLPANKHQFKNGKLAKDEELDYKLPLMGIASHFPRRKAAPLQKDDYVIKTKKLYRGKVKNSLLKAIDLK